jgi:hypothetical protein
MTSLSPWRLLANATLIFDKVSSYSTDPITGNKIAVHSQQYVTRAYLKKAMLVANESRGVPVGSYIVEGYTVGILPTWAKTSILERVRCTVDDLGKGHYYQHGKIHVVKSQVEKAGQGTQLQGYIVIDGANL